MTPVIEVKGISKLFSIGSLGTGSFRQDLKHWWTREVLRKNDPFFMGAESDRGHIWALNDVSFSVAEGEVFGIIGSNGAGKSTLLKILSGITPPTRGSIRGRGRVNSLLEVGTGFNSELSGRENVYLNGYFLGMKPWEIRKKFDEIVEFSGVAQFIDTPVKRYSSGMYMRLAFAVAAHLEPDILIVDEVLAVGDAEFQKKCLGKMHEVSSQQGRTILYVSHNMPSVINLCNRVLHLHKGKVADIGAASRVVNTYLNRNQARVLHRHWDDPDAAPGNHLIRVSFVDLIPHRVHVDHPIDIRTPLTIRFKFWNFVDGQNLCIGLHLFTQSRECIFDVNTMPRTYKKGLIEGQCDIPGNFLNDGSYYFSLIFVKDTSVEVFYLEECLSFEVEDVRENMQWYGKWIGYVRPKFPFRVTQVTIEEEMVAENDV